MNYKKVKLGDVVRIIDGDRGKNYPNQTQLFQSGDCLFLSAKNFVNNKLVPNPAQFISNEKDTLMGNGKIITNDLILTTRGTIGLIAKYDKNFPYKKVRINSGMVILRCFKNIIDTNYLFYTLTNQESQYQIKSLSSGSAQPQIPIKDLRNLEISLPPLSSQHRIANILSSFDNKIELLRKENNTLEDIAQSIFKEWFVKYNFPNKDGKPYRDNNGKMIDSELGLIPEGWRVGKLGEVITLQTGFVHNTSITGPAKSLIAKMGVVDGISRFNRNSVIPYSKSIDSKYKLEENDLIVCTRDVTRDNLVIGNVSQTPPDLAVRGLYAGSNTWIIKSNLNKNYLFLYLRERKFREHIIKSSKGSTIVMITQDAFLKCPYIFPQEEIINLFNETNEDLFKKAKVNDQEIQNLENIKSHLLNKLLT